MPQEGRPQNSTCMSAILWITSPLTLQLSLLMALSVVAPQSNATTSALISALAFIFLTAWLITAAREIFCGATHNKHSHETASSLMET